MNRFDCEVQDVTLQALHEAVVECEAERDDLRRSRDLLHSVMGAMYEGLVLIDREYRIQEVNDGFLQQLGTTRDQVVGRCCYEITHGLDRPCSAPDHRCPTAEVMKTGQSVSLEHIHKGPNEEDLIVELTAVPLFGADGRVELIAEVSRDVTQLRHAEEERSHREKLAAVLETAGTACHELNQPLQLVSFHAEQLLRETDGDTQEKVGKIVTQVDRLAQITRRLQQITRYDTKDYVGGVKILDLDAEAIPQNRQTGQGTS